MNPSFFVLLIKVSSSVYCFTLFLLFSLQPIGMLAEDMNIACYVKEERCAKLQCLCKIDQLNH